MEDTRSRNLYQKLEPTHVTTTVRFNCVWKGLVPETCTKQNAALFSASFYTADQSNCTILVTCVSSSFWYKFLQRMSPLLVLQKKSVITMCCCDVQWTGLGCHRCHPKEQHTHWRHSSGYHQHPSHNYRRGQCDDSHHTCWPLPSIWTYVLHTDKCNV